MGFFQDVISKLFSSDKEGEAPDTGVRKILTRGHRFNKEYAEWQNDREHLEETLQSLMDSYSKAAIVSDVRGNFFLYTSPQSNGFYFTNNLPLHQKEFYFLMDYFAERILDTGYEKYVSDVEISEVETGVRSKQRHYLKPPKPGAGQRYNQLYGNVIIEVVAKDDEPQYLKLMANVYASAKYEHAKPFDKLVQLIFSGS